MPNRAAFAARASARSGRGSGFRVVSWPRAQRGVARSAQARQSTKPMPMPPLRNGNLPRCVVGGGSLHFYGMVVDTSINENGNAQWPGESTIIFHAGCDTWFTPPFSRTVRTFQEVSAPCAPHFCLEWGRLAAALPASGDAPLAPGPCPRPRPAGGAGTPRPECAPPRFVATSARPVPRMAVGECGDALFRGGGCLIVRHFRPSD